MELLLWYDTLSLPPYFPLSLTPSLTRTLSLLTFAFIFVSPPFHPLQQDFNVKKYAAHIKDTIIPVGFLYLDPGTRTSNAQLISDISKLAGNFKDKFRIFAFQDGYAWCREEREGECVRV